MKRLEIHNGDVFGYLTIVEEVDGIRYNNSKVKRRFKCQCKCGKILDVRLYSLTSGWTKSCGCYNKEASSKQKTNYSHGLTTHPLYSVWRGMKRRCYKQSDRAYRWYGAHGVTVCDEWKENFKCFYDWAIVNGYKKGLELDRENVLLGYSPTNCRFITKLDNINRSSFVNIQKRRNNPQVEVIIPDEDGRIKKRRLVIPGEVFGILKVIKELDGYKSGKITRRTFLCVCECGKQKEVRLYNLVNGHTVSCGCFNKLKSSLSRHNVTHGLCNHPLYVVWQHMKERCNNPNNDRYFRYGGRGIMVCKEWDNDFIVFYNWSIEHGFEENKNLELDRRNNDLGYNPDNCRFVTSEVNANNKSNNIKYVFNDKKLTLPQIARLTKVKFPTLYRRINVNKLSLDEALSIPHYGKCKKDRLTRRALTSNQAIEIFISKDTPKTLSEKYNIHISSIRRIIKNHAYKDVIEAYKQKIN